MRTLTLLTALLLLAFQAQAETLQETADQVPAQDQPDVEEQDLFDDEDQDVAISFTGEERFAREAARLRKKKHCSCHLGFCPVTTRSSGSCRLYGNLYTLCCR